MMALVKDEEESIPVVSGLDRLDYQSWTGIRDDEQVHSVEPSLRSNEKPLSVLQKSGTDKLELPRLSIPTLLGATMKQPDASSVHSMFPHTTTPRSPQRHKQMTVDDACDDDDSVDSSSRRLMDVLSRAVAASDALRKLPIQPQATKALEQPRPKKRRTLQLLSSKNKHKESKSLIKLLSRSGATKKTEFSSSTTKLSVLGTSPVDRKKNSLLPITCRKSLVSKMKATQSTLTKGNVRSANHKHSYDVGTPVMKYFAGYGWFTGRIIQRDNFGWKVCYTDNDEETYLLDEVEELESIIRNVKKVKYNVGTKVYKKFAGYGLFNGTIANVLVDRYLIRYEDGDEEEYLFDSSEELDEIVRRAVQRVPR